MAEQYKQVGNAAACKFGKRGWIINYKISKKVRGGIVKEYNLSFIDDIDLYNHVKDTIEKYRFKD